MMSHFGESATGHSGNYEQDRTAGCTCSPYGLLAFDCPLINPPVSRKRKKKRLPKIISAAEAQALLAAANDGSDIGLRNQLMLELMYRAGLRVSEVVSLRPRDVEADGMIRVYDAKGGDGTAYFDPDTIGPLMERWLAIRWHWVPSYEKDARLFVKYGGQPITIRYIQRLVKKLKTQLGIAGICTPHVLRHTFATELIGEGFTLPEVQTALRHANLQTTAVYLHVRDESLRRKISRRGRLPTEEGG